MLFTVGWMDMGILEGTIYLMAMWQHLQRDAPV